MKKINVFVVLFAEKGTEQVILVTFRLFMS